MHNRRSIQRMSKDYNVQVFLLYAASMGIPQIRNRVFIIGLIKDIIKPKLELDFDCPQTTFSITKKYWDLKSNIKMVPCLIKEWDNVEIGGNSKKYFNLHKPSLNKPCFTITETASTGAASVLHPLQKRKLNIEEVRLLSTFPKIITF